MKFLTIKAHRYAGISRQVGDEYEIEGQGHARLTKALGWVTPAPDKVAAPEAAAPDTVAARDAAAPEVPAPEAAEAPAAEADAGDKNKRGYKRRDLVAEGKNE